MNFWKEKKYLSLGKIKLRRQVRPFATGEIPFSLEPGLELEDLRPTETKFNIYSKR